MVWLMFFTEQSRQKLVLSSVSIALLALSSILYASNSQAQSLVDVSSEDAQLVAAERALLEGLASKGADHAESDFSNAPLQPEDVSRDDASNVSVSQADVSDTAIKAEAFKFAPQQPTDPKLLPVKHDLTPKLIVEAHGINAHEHIAPPPVHQSALKRELEANQKRVAELERQLEEVKGQLTMAETELSRLATISEARNRASFGRTSVPGAVSTSTARTSTTGTRPAVTSRGRIETAAIEPMPTSADLTIATVGVDKVELRLGPGKNHSAIMTVARGSRLAVEARQGDWLRVFAPNGQRAWVLARLVTFGAHSSKNPTSTVQVKGYSSSLEDEAFRRVQSMTAGH